MVLSLVAHRVPRSGLGARRQTGRSPANSSGTVLLLYPRSLRQDVPFSSLLRSTATWRERAIRCPSSLLADIWRRTEERRALRESWTFGGYQSSANQLWPRGGPLYRVDGPSGFTQAAENHGRTISERHNRSPQRRAQRF